jgi:hypothetical protein
VVRSDEITSTLLGLDVQHMKTLAKKWGNIPRLLLKYLRKEDQVIDGQRMVADFPDDDPPLNNCKAWPAALSRAELAALADPVVVHQMDSCYILYPLRRSGAGYLCVIPS